MWELQNPKPVRLIVGILAASDEALSMAVDSLQEWFGKADFKSEVWAFTQTEYYRDQIGDNILRQFISIEKLIDPGELALIKHKSNELERELAERLKLNLPRPVNLDPGIIEPSKLILATTKNFSHRIYIGKKMYAELTLIFNKGRWESFGYTFPDYKQTRYHEFFSKVRERLVQQLRDIC
ncbi:MAG: DUF4416 family protein [Phycisphaerae bacterium]